METSAPGADSPPTASAFKAKPRSGRVLVGAGQWALGVVARPGPINVAVGVGIVAAIAAGFVAVGSLAPPPTVAGEAHPVSAPGEKGAPVLPEPGTNDPVVVPPGLLNEATFPAVGTTRGDPATGDQHTTAPPRTPRGTLAAVNVPFGDALMPGAKAPFTPLPSETPPPGGGPQAQGAPPQAPAGQAPPAQSSSGSGPNAAPAPSTPAPTTAPAPSPTATATPTTAPDPSPTTAPDPSPTATADPAPTTQASSPTVSPTAAPDPSATP